MDSNRDVRQPLLIACAIGVLSCFSLYFATAPAGAQEPQPNETHPQPQTETPPTPSEVPADRPLSELDESEKPPPAPEQPAAEAPAAEQGPPAPTDAQPSALEECKEIQQEMDTMLQRVRRTLAVTACASSAWLDGLFGNQFHYDEYRDTRGSVSLGTLWSQYDGFDPSLQARVRLRLPQWDERVSAFAGRVGEEHYISDTEGEFNALPTRIFGGLEDESVLVGLGYSSPQRTGNDFDVGVGVRIDLPIDPYVRARYEIVRTFAEHYVFRARETVFWQNSEGFGSTTRFNIDRALSDRFLLRWNNIGKWTEETLGLEWYSELTLFQKLNERTGIAWQSILTGQSDNSVGVTRYGARAIMRRQLTPDWLFVEARLGVTWPRFRPWEERESSVEAGVAFEIQFSDLR